MASRREAGSESRPQRSSEPWAEFLAAKIESRRPGRASGEERVVIVNSAGEKAAWGLVFWGKPGRGLRPWADLVVTDTSILPEVANMLGPGASLMVAYGEDETERALRRKVPPQATPLGVALLEAGCRWFKDWYFPEGGMEGGTKLQGTIPLDRRRRVEGARRLLGELDSWERSGSPGVESAIGEWAQRARGILRADLNTEE